ncbi:Lon protease family protein [Oleiphilus messinensis]|nr:ATP-binding protein [Oleiphilus messinensis]
MKPSPLSPRKLYAQCNTSDFSFQSTKTLQPLDEIIGQARAQDALKFAMAMPSSGYNIYAVGPSGLGKRTMMLRYLRQHVDAHDGVVDWCYVNNFDDIRQPRVLKLPAGLGIQFKKDVEKLMFRLVKAIPQAFDNDSYYERSEQLKNELADKQEKQLLQVSKQAQKKGVNLTVTTPGGYRLVAMNGEEPHTAETFSELTADEQQHFEDTINKLEKKLRGTLRKLANWEQDYLDKQQQLNEEVTLAVTGHLIDDLEAKYEEQKNVIGFLETMRKDLVDNVDIFLEDNDEHATIAYASLDKKMPRRYQVNVLVNRKDGLAPIVVEDNPNYHNLFGYVENVTYKGTVFTDFSLIRAGSLHKANGGYLLMDAIKVLEQPFVWDGLKRALRSSSMAINALEREMTLSGTISLEPEHIPLNVKIILFGDRETYLLLQQYDSEFQELFKVTADFEGEMARTPENQVLYAKFISSLVHEKGLRHCDKKAVMKIIEHSSRIAEDQNKLSLHAADIANLLRESDYWAEKQDSKQIKSEHVIKALDSAKHRSSRIRDQIYEGVENGSTLLTVSGAVVGQVNALSVLTTGDSEFGIVSRITAVARYGDGDVIDIERDVKLGGTIHSKGVLILSSYLAHLFGQTDHLTLSASITFEQSYGEVDGDSATIAEFCTLLSAMSGLPVRQDIAVTGSMNQKGEVQPVGGVNQKIEGFYDTCMILGADNTQGVIMPETNVHNLMLKQDVLDAAAKKTFSVYSVSHVNEAIALMFGKPAGEPNTDGKFPPRSVFGTIQQRLAKLKETDKDSEGGAKSKS